MPDTKITALTAIGANPIIPATFPIPMVDLTDTSMAASGTTKKVTVNQILGAGGTATLASATITGDLTVDTSTLKVDSANDRVGVGTATPSHKLEVATLGSDTRVRINSTSVVCTEYFRSGTGLWLVGSDSTNAFKIARGSNFGGSADYFAIAAATADCTWYDGAGGTRMTLNSAGLGVGLVPALGNGKFQVQGGVNYDGQFNLTAQFVDVTTSASKGVLLGYNNTTNNGIISAAYGNGTEGLTFWTHNGSSWGQRMELTATGNVGIGVTPSAWRNTQRALQIGAVGGLFSSAASTGSTCVGRNVYESAAGDFTYIVNDEATFYEQTATGTHAWYTAAAGTGTISFGDAKMTLDASGNLLVGKTAIGTTVGVEVRPDGYIIATRSASTDAAAFTNAVYSTGASAYRFYVGLGGTVFATNTTISAISDARLKENVQDIDVGLGAILALKPRKFDWKAGKGKDIKGDRGFIAQEFEQVFPQLVDQWADEAPEGEAPYKSVRQDLIPVLVKAIQELAARVQTLETR